MICPKCKMNISKGRGRKVHGVWMHKAKGYKRKILQVITRQV